MAQRPRDSGAPTDAELAELRNAAWPRFHAVAVYRVRAGSLRRISLSNTEDLGTCAGEDGAFLALRRREHVLSKDATVEKFDSNASGWNGEPGGPGYPHFRWMREASCWPL